MKNDPHYKLIKHLRDENLVEFALPPLHAQSECLQSLI